MHRTTSVLVVLGLAALLPAQDLAIAKAAARIDSAIPWITDGFHAIDIGRPVANLPKADRGKLLDEALARAAAEKKPVLWYIPRIEGGHMVRPEILDAYMRIVAWTNPRVTQLVNARFVPLRMACDVATGERMGIKALDWVEPAIVILDENGKIVRRLDRIRTFDAWYFEHVLATALGESTFPTDAVLDVVTARAVGLRAVQSPAEKLYRAAIAGVRSRESGQAEAAFGEIVARFGEDAVEWPWAAMAAGNLLKHRDSTPLGPAFHNFESGGIDYPPSVLTHVSERTTTGWPRTPADTDDVVKRAVATLLQNQGESGGFEDSRYAWCDTPRILPNVWVAITAIALAGLNDWRQVDPKRIDTAIEAGEAYLFDGKNIAIGRNEECYADSFRLVYLARRLATLPADSPRAAWYRKRAKDIAGALVDQQSEAGMHAHEYPNAFASAAAILALDQAREIGAPVPESFFTAGAAAIRASRGEKGTFSYSGRRAPGRETDGAFKNAMGRMPICERALLCANKDGTREPLEAALDNFWKYLPRIERIRTCDFHSDGELGGFFFWHAMFLTSESIKALPEEDRAEHHRKMLEHVLKIGEIDGSFVDSHELGKSYGTGMALMVLRNSAGRKP